MSTKGILLLIFIMGLLGIGTRDSAGWIKSAAEIYDRLPENIRLFDAYGEENLYADMDERWETLYGWITDSDNETETLYDQQKKKNDRPRKFYDWAGSVANQPAIVFGQPDYSFTEVGRFSSLIIKTADVFGRMADAVASAASINVSVEELMEINGYRQPITAESFREWDGMGAIRELMGDDYEGCLGWLMRKEIQVYYKNGFDEEGRNYLVYEVCPYNEREPLLCIGRISDHWYISDGARFWSNDVSTDAMPVYFSPAEEAVRRVTAYGEIRKAEWNATYIGIERKPELWQAGCCLHCQVKWGYRVFDAYLDEELQDPYFFVTDFAKREEGYKKCQSCVWKAEDGTEYSFAFYHSFQYRAQYQNRRYRETGDLTAQMFRDGIDEGYMHLNEETDWILSGGYIVVDDYNFDGYPDIAVAWGETTDQGDRSSDLFVCEGENLGNYVEAGVFCTVPHIDRRTQTLRDYSRGGEYDLCWAYSYENGSYVRTASLRTDRNENSALTYTVWSETKGQEIYRGENTLSEEWKEFWGIDH